MSPPASEPMILRSAESGEVLRVNRAFTDESGLTGEELAPQPLLDWIHPDDRAGLEQTLSAGEGSVRARHRTSRDDWMSLDWRVMSRDGDTVALGIPHRESRAAVVPPELGAPLPHTSLADTLEAMVRIVEAKSGGMRCSILLVDDEHEFVSVGAGPSLPAAYNEAVEGLRIGPAVGSCGTASYWNVPVIVEDIGTDPLWKDLREAAAIAGVSACWSVPITATDDGEVLGAMALYDTKPSAPSRQQMDVLEISARMVGLAIDRDRLEGQLRQSAKMEAIGVLAGGLAHDFNNLLTVIMGNAELASASLPEGAKAAEKLKRIVTACVTATDLCNQMLAYAGRGSTTAETLDCNALVRDLGDLLRVAFSEKVALVYDMHTTPLGVVADPSQLRQVVMNLITNAFEAVGGEEGRVVISTSAATFTREQLEQHHPNAMLEPGEYIRVQVSDSGVGMNPATQAKVFDPFFTTKPNGRGLGMAAVRGIVRDHKGLITVESVEGAGTTVCVMLPRVPLSGDDSRIVPEQSAGQRMARILVVDDQRVVRELLANALAEAGYSVVEARNGPEAIELFRRDGDSIDCVLLDLSMPNMDGEEVFHQLRKMRSDVRVILSSGFTEQEIMDRFQGAGLAGVVQKPTQLHVLRAKVAEALRGGEATQRA